MFVANLSNTLRKIPVLFSLLKFLKLAWLAFLHPLEGQLLLAQARLLCKQFRPLPKQPVPREKPHLIILTDFNLPEGYECDTAYELWILSLKEANLCTFTRLTMPKSMPGKLRFARELFSVCYREKPDYLFLALGGNPAIFPPPHFWNLLCNTFPAPFFVLLADSLPHFIKYLENLGCLSGVVSIDASEPCLKSPILKEKCCFTPSPVCTSIFHDQPDSRNILVSFMGMTANHYEYRAKAIAQIKQMGISVYTGGGYTQRVSLQKMADIYRDSLFVLNFSGKPDRIVQCKGRVMEATLCGACLIEFNNPETNRWLQPDVSYLAYDSINDIPDKVQYLLEHPEKLQQIRQAGTRRAQELFGASKVWQKILEFAKERSAIP